MSALPGHLQAVFTAGELDPSLHERFELKYFSTGCRKARNVQFLPQGGFVMRAGLMDAGGAAATATRLVAFHSSDGKSYQLTLSDKQIEVWHDGAKTYEFAAGSINLDYLTDMSFASSQDEMLCFHEDMPSQQIIHLGPVEWTIADVPLENLPLYDYGEDYSNGVPAVWQLEFIGLTDTSVFTLTVSNQVTTSLTYDATSTPIAEQIEATILALPNVSIGVNVTDLGSNKYEVVFSGGENVGDGWAVSGEVINKTDAAITSSKTVDGVRPGEPIISPDRGWARCGVFYQQRLFLGGFKSLGNAYLFSKQGEFYNFDDRFTEANGPALIPMDLDSGERIVEITKNRNLLIFTNDAEYWLAERAVSATDAPNHVQSSRHGISAGVPVVENEGAALFVHGNGNVLAEFRYTDVAGTFAAIDISLLAAHMVQDVTDVAQRSASTSSHGNSAVLVKSSGHALLVTLLREQDVTAYSTIETGSQIIAVCATHDGVISLLADQDGNKRLLQFNDDCLLDDAVTGEFDIPTETISGLDNLNGKDVWVIADDHVFKVTAVVNGEVTLPIAVTSWCVGTWIAPLVETLPVSPMVAHQIAVRRKKRIHSVHLSVVDTTSIALSVNGGKIFDLDLRKYGDLAHVPELAAGFTGEISLRGLVGFQDGPTVTITQVRPGRLNVRSLTIETTR